MAKICKGGACCWRFILKTQASHQTSVDECREVTRPVQMNVDESQSNVDEHQTSVEECKRVQTSQQTTVDEYVSVDESLDGCRQCRFVGKSKIWQSDTCSHFVVVVSMQEQATYICKFSILQLALEQQIAKQLSGLNPLLLSSNKNYKK